ncbi:MAG: rhodanese-like domain-containing protein [Bryobacteraceae bacterium]|jgi:rhodanese-related sulfurtransferase
MRIIEFMVLASCLLAFPCFAQQAAKPATPGFRTLVSEANAHIRHMDTKDLGRLISDRADFILIDVRETEEWTNGHAVGAQHISRGVLEGRIEAAVPGKDKRVILYCAGGARSALAAESLQRMGYSNVWSLDGGIAAYKAAGLPME